MIWSGEAQIRVWCEETSSVLIFETPLETLKEILRKFRSEFLIPNKLISHSIKILLQTKYEPLMGFHTAAQNIEIMKGS
eukprot:snap_masked-scaffold_35-processed-gene-2.33-mRNA-1 protein AED:1.00 eAED:1.00 QI:0/-1/0/0/-1/1/1/0/78